MDEAKSFPVKNGIADSEFYALGQGGDRVAAAHERGSLIAATAAEMPDAIAQIANDAWNNKLQTVAHVAYETLTAGVTGTMFGYAVPAKGPAALLVTAVFTVPLVAQGIFRAREAVDDYSNPKLDPDQVSKALAKDFLSGSGNLSLNLIGGYAGTAFGAHLAYGGDAMGNGGQSAQRVVGKAENSTMLMTKKGVDFISSFGSDKSTNAVGVGKSAARTNVVGGSGTLEEALAPRAEAPIVLREPVLAKGFVRERMAVLGQRIDQYSFATSPQITTTVAQEPGLQLRKGSTHGHSRYSDGMGLPKDLYAKGMAEGQEVTTITDHNHLAARDGIHPDDPRAKDQEGTPILAASPIEYTQTQIDAQQTTIPGKHVSLYGIEMGTIGGIKHVHDGLPHDHGGAAEGTKGSAKKLIADIPDEHDFETSQLGPTEEQLAIQAAREKLILARHGHDGELTDANPDQLTARDPVPKDAGKSGDQAQITPVTPESPEQPGDIHVTGHVVPERLVPFNWKVAQLESLEAAHLGGVNHINILESPDFFETKRVKKTGPAAFVSRLVGGDPIELKNPKIVEINDGNYKHLSEVLDTTLDSMGKKVLVTLNHPRAAADNNPKLPPDQRGRDYGRKSFKDDDEWRRLFAKPYVRGIELIKGGALNPNPVDKVPTGMVDLRSYTYYLGLGVEAGPVFGRDFHFGDPVGNPGSTGFLASSLDKGPILDSMRERRTMASTHFDKLNGYMMANDKFPMGTIFDQTVVPDIKLKMKMGGQIEPDAQYTFKVYGDEKVLDGNDAVVVQTKQLTGQEILAARNEVGFDEIKHKMGNNSLYFIEVTRKDSAGDVERMWTSPVWVQPLVGTGHGLLTRLSAGSMNQWFPTIQSITPGSH